MLNRPSTALQPVELRLGLGIPLPFLDRASNLAPQSATTKLRLRLSVPHPPESRRSNRPFRDLHSPAQLGRIATVRTANRAKPALRLVCGAAFPRTANCRRSLLR